MDSSFSGSVLTSADDAADQVSAHNRRRNLLVVVASVGFVAAIVVALTYSQWNPSGTTASGGTHATLADATKCLSAGGALVTPVPHRDFPTASAIRASFVLQPTRPFDSAILYFEPDRTTAQRELAATARRELAPLPAPQKQQASSALFNDYFQLENNVVVFWENPKAAPASRSAVLGCLS